MTNQQIFDNAIKNVNLEKIQETLNDYNNGFIPEEEVVEDILLNLGIIDKPISLKIKEYEEKAHDMVKDQINQTLGNNKS